MTTTATTAPTYYRTAKGSHRHHEFTCANFRRSIQLGDVLVIPAGEVDEWAPCEVCCSPEAVAEHARVTAIIEAAAPAKCANNRGVTKPGRIYSSCKVCGKEGKVSQVTGSLRAHNA